MIRTRTTARTRDGKAGGRILPPATPAPRPSGARSNKKSTRAGSKRRRGEGKSTSRQSSASAKSTKNVRGKSKKKGFASPTSRT